MSGMRFVEILQSEYDDMIKERDEARRERDELRTALAWLDGGGTGNPSRDLVWTWLGLLRPCDSTAPSDSMGRSGCICAIQLMPWLLPTLEKLESQSEQWREQGKLIRAELNGEAKS